MIISYGSIEIKVGIASVIIKGAMSPIFSINLKKPKDILALMQTLKNASVLSKTTSVLK